MNHDNSSPPLGVNRRKFLRNSAVISTTFTTALSPLSKLHGAAAPATDSALYLPPFLARPTGKSIFITALTGEQSCEAVIEVREVATTEWKRQGEPLTAKEFSTLNWNIETLAPATRYEYQVLTRREADEAFSPAANGSFITQRTEPASYRAVIITDPHTGTFPEGSQPVQTLDKVIANAVKENGEFVLALGDNVAWSASRSAAQTDTNGAVTAYSMYRRHAGPLMTNCPHFSIIGNWEGESGKYPEESIQMISKVRKSFLPNPNHETYPQGGNDNEDYFAFSWGGVFYVMLNVQTYSKPTDPAAVDSAVSDVSSVDDWTLGEKQMAWFEKTLANATEPYRFVCMHHAAGGNAGNNHDTIYGRGGAQSIETGEQVKIHGLMKEHKVQIYFYGHDHVFVDDEVDVIHYALPGSCGVPAAWKFHNSQTGHARLEVTPEKATFTYVNLEGEAIHSFSVLPV